MNPVATAVFRHMVSKVGDDMTDTLKSDLNGVISALLEAGLGLKSTHVAAVEKAIAELDRLEAEVKKPRLPEGWKVEKIGMSGRELIGIQHDDDERHGGFWLDQIETKRDSAFVDFLSAFLPDVVPSTEPVQAAGDAKQYGIFGNHTDRLTDYHVEVSLINSLVNEHLRHGLHDKDQLLARIDRAWLNVVQPEWVEVKNRLREIHSALIAPAETSDQGQRSQTPTKQGCKHSHAERDPEGGMRCMSCKVNLHKPKAAEKPKPVSLVEKFSRERIGGNIDYWAKNTFGSPSHDQEAREIILWILRTLDQERGV